MLRNPLGLVIGGNPQPSVLNVEWLTKYAVQIVPRVKVSANEYTHRSVDGFMDT